MCILHFMSATDFIWFTSDEIGIDALVADWIIDIPM